MRSRDFSLRHPLIADRRWLGLAVALLLLTASTAPAQIFGVQIRGFSGDFVHYLAIDPAGPATDQGLLFGAPSVYGLTYHAGNGTLYGLEWESNTASFLVAITNFGNAVSTRLFPSMPVNGAVFPDLESLAYRPTDDKLYATSFNFGAHTGGIGEVNPSTGVGAMIGTFSQPDVFIVGLASSPNGTLYGVSRTWASQPTPTLYTLDPAGARGAIETVVGPLGLSTNPEGFGPIESLTWDQAGNRLIGAFDQLYVINTTTGAATPLGGDYTTTAMSDGVYALADLTAPSAVEPESWAGIKTRYRIGR